MSIHFYVFSFNRGAELRNCINSIERNLPGASIDIYDDGSDDPETVTALSRFQGSHNVVIRRESSSHKHGGLYANMQCALDAACQQSEKFCCFIQDDMQIVRPVDARDISAIETYFQARPSSAFLSPNFAKGRPRDLPKETHFFDEVAGAYIAKPRKQSAGIYYADVFIAQPVQLNASGWKFQDGEPQNELQAKALYAEMGALFAPFAMWLPYGTAYRGKRKTLALKLAERIRRCGFYPFQDMGEDAVNKLRSRAADELPTAESYLSLEGGLMPKPWIYYPLEGSWWLKKMNSFEGFLRRTLLS